MAFFLFNGNHLSFSSRLNIIALITIVLLCFCSYCSSSSPVLSLIDADSSFDDNDIYGIADEITYYTPLKLSSHRYRNIPEQIILPSKNQLRNILLQSFLIPSDYRYKLDNNKRYTSQAFHAVRG